MSYKKEYEIGLEDIGAGNVATDIAILKKLEEIAERNSYEVGFGLEHLAYTNKAWLLLDWKVEIYKRPKYKDKISVETWSTKMERCYGYRDFEIYDEENTLLGKGSSKWVLIDIDKRRPIRINEEDALKYATYDKGYTVFESDIEKLDEPEELEFVKEYEIRRSDIDANKHVNNIVYLELAFETIPLEAYSKSLYDNVRITYKKEVKYGENVKCYYTYKEDKHIVTIKSNEIADNGTILEEKTNAIIELY